MICLIRHWWRRCFPPQDAPTLTDHLRDARAYGVAQQREAYRSIRSLRDGHTGNFAEEDIFATSQRREKRP